jgi:putative oxidoreductase
MIESLTGTHADWVVGIARIVLGIIFFAHGAQKLLGWFSGPGLANSMRTFTEHLHLPSTLAFLVIAGEFFSGIGLIVGLFSRIAALVIALTMVGAIATVHWRFGLFLNWLGTQEGHGIEYHLLTIALALIVVVNGAGAFSLDRLVYEHFSGSEQSAAAVDNDGGERYREDPKVGRHTPERQCSVIGTDSPSSGLTTVAEQLIHNQLLGRGINQIAKSTILVRAAEVERVERGTRRPSADTFL